MRPIPNTTDAVQLRILAWMEQEGLSAEQMAKRAGVAEGAVRDIRKPTWRPTFTTVKKIEALIPEGYAPPPVFAARRPRKSHHAEHGAVA